MALILKQYLTGELVTLLRECLAVPGACGLDGHSHFAWILN